jgi:hypothetical protein
VRARLTPEDARKFHRRLGRLIEDFRKREGPEGTQVKLAVALWGERDGRA